MTSAVKPQRNMSSEYVVLADMLLYGSRPLLGKGSLQVL